jgi:hypothetical protein
MTDSRLFIAPRNALAAPSERAVRRWPGSHEVPVLVRLVWSTSTQVVPGVVVRAARDRVLVRWHPSARDPQTRMTWLSREDVRTELRHPGEGEPWPST